ncbi:hypothetical protein Skr01_72050 [Sphaerisporangium krabiense]|uniref:Uncharacterized protein n=1 Tax=Sphaerisporangium krabiense TaxID=763782 RepID=A0A7W9DRU1_9ACTN|nr:hypothetical protein [Sphaerisporangium krabiense]MBB5628479.1 hypothetical protein [Sphaerisporangium krabiense]GII67120.1 hypothetical protein Skr01_72050 [Sphaerisporangium krabiense]
MRIERAMDIAGLVRVRDEDLAEDPVGHASGAGARMLMESIMSEERVAVSPRPNVPLRRRLVLGGAGVVGLAAAVTIGFGLPIGGPVTEYANAAVSISKADDDYSITITDPAADPRRLEEAFRAVGVNATVRQVPAMPDHVGKLYGPARPSGDDSVWKGSMSLTPVEPCASAFCATLTVSGGSPDQLVFGIGRPARPGEPYADLPPTLTGRYADALDGYRSDGYRVRGKTVADVRAELDRRGLKAVYQLWWSYADGGFFPEPVSADRIKDDWIVESSRAYSSDTIELTVVPGPEAGPAPTPSPRPHWWDLPEG